MLLEGAVNELHFGEPEVLSAAKFLRNGSSIRSVYPKSVTYVHFACDRHEVVLANQAWSETLYPGDIALISMSATERHELFTIFPELNSTGMQKPMLARPTLRNFEASLLTRIIHEKSAEVA
jgi:hypothetical protein